MHSATCMKNTKSVSRRVVHYDNLSQMLQDVDRLAAVKAPTTGNWSMAQILDHLTILLDGSVRGFDFRAAWPVRFVLSRFLKNRFLHKPMPAGFKLPRRAQASLSPRLPEISVALENIHRAVGAFNSVNVCFPHPALGDLTKEEWHLLHCRHSELHLSFVAEPEK
jgi:hypothetical protein